MSEISAEMAPTEPEKPVVTADDVSLILPPYPDPTDDDFDDDISDEEKAYYKTKFADLNSIVSVRLHCTACDRHLGCSAANESRMRPHPMLRTLICLTCHSFYNSGEFDKGEDGSELYCRWCGQGGQVYCCSECVHVFCAKCIKRNMGLPKIREIENTDDWKCFKCNPKCLWDLRAICWALLRYCDLRNKLVIQTEDVEQRQNYARIIAIDKTECCKNKARRSQKMESTKKKEKETESITKKIISKMPPTIQVKKFASVSMEDIKPKIEKKAQKRPASPKNKAIMIKNPITIAPCPMTTSISKKFRMPTPNMYSPIRYPGEKKILTRVARPRILGPNFNGFNSPGVYMNNMNNINLNNMNHMNNMNLNLVNDNINLSLDSLTQGLDFAAVQAMNNSNPSFENNDDVVCTPDFPLEPLCEVTEDNDDDVECITPGPVAAPKVSNPPPLVPTRNNPINILSKGNVIQMTDSDVTVNALTGGLKFRVDPQTLSSNKMYRLPDGRIFAINANPNMPGGYSATIVSQNPDGSPKVTPRSETFAAKLSAVTLTSPKAKRARNTIASKRKNSPKPKASKLRDETEGSRTTDLKVPVEWFRYNMVDAVDALEYSLTRLHKVKKDATSAYLRTRTVDEMKYLHRTLEQLLTTSSKRFLEIRDTLNKEMKVYIEKKNENESNIEEEDDDDVEILPNTENEDPIFIDENSDNEGQEVDLTATSSGHNDSNENRNDVDPLNAGDQEHENNDSNEDSNSTNVLLDFCASDAETSKNNGDAENAKEHLLENNDCEKMETDEVAEKPVDTTETISGSKINNINGDDGKTGGAKIDEDITDDEETTKHEEDKAHKNDETQQNDKDADARNDGSKNEDEENTTSIDDESTKEKADQENNRDHDADMSEEMIETLLKDDNLDEHPSMEMSDLQEAEEILS